MNDESMSPHTQGTTDVEIQNDVYDPLNNLSKQKNTTNDQNGSSDEIRGLGEQRITNSNQQSEVDKQSAELRRTQRASHKGYTMNGNSDQVTEPNEQEIMNTKETNVTDQVVGPSEQESGNGCQKSEQDKPGVEHRHPQLRAHVIDDTNEDNGNGRQPSDTENTGSADVNDIEAVAMALPRCVRKLILVILNVRPGHRRHGEIQSRIEETNANTDYVTGTLSLDIDASANRENQASRKAVKLWSDRITTGQVQGAVAGKPCETWSGGRRTDNGPQQMRTWEQRWRRRDHTKRENDQTSTANLQQMAFLSIVMRPIEMGGSAIPKHPAIEHWQQQVPNIRGAVFMTSTTQCEDCEKFKLDQKRYLALRLPALGAQSLSAPNCGQRQQPSGHCTSQGRAAEMGKRMAMTIHQAASAKHSGTLECTSTDEAIRATQAEATVPAEQSSRHRT
jgi:hypothetical protein